MSPSPFFHMFFRDHIQMIELNSVDLQTRCLSLIVGVGLWSRGLWANPEGPHRLCAGHLLWPYRKTAGFMFSWHEHQTLGLSGIWVHPNNAWWEIFITKWQVSGTLPYYHEHCICRTKLLTLSSRPRSQCVICSHHAKWRPHNVCLKRQDH